jgi:hypothetical protein
VGAALTAGADVAIHPIQAGIGYLLYPQRNSEQNAIRAELAAGMP